MTTPKKDEVYQHYKGNYYRVITISNYVNDLFEMITYQNIKTSEIWTRKLNDWNKKTEDGQERFKPILIFCGNCKFSIINSDETWNDCDKNCSMWEPKE